MTSQIDTTKPVFGTPTTQSVRDNFTTAANEITALQVSTVGAPFLPEAGGHMTGPVWLYNDPTDAMQPVTLQYAQVNFGAPGGAPAVPEAPTDSNYYARFNGAWAPVVPIGGGSGFPLTGELILAGDPTDALGAVPKQYADAISAAMLPDSPHDSTTYGRNNGAWVHTLASSGGQITGSVGLGITIPTTPAPSLVELFAPAVSVANEFDLNAYASGASAWNYLGNGSAARFSLPATGMLGIAAANTGTASAAITWGPALNVDYKGSVTFGGAGAIPTDTQHGMLSGPGISLSTNGSLAINGYPSSSGWKYLATSYAAQITIDGSGNLVFNLAPQGTVSTGITFGHNFYLTQSGQLTASNASIGGVAFNGSQNISSVENLTMAGTLTGNYINCSNSISSNQSFFAGTTNPTVMSVEGIVYQSLGGTNWMGFTWGGGYVYSVVDAIGQGNLAWETSDAELKRNFAAIEVDCLDAINRIALQQFDWEVVRGNLKGKEGEPLGPPLPHWSCGYTAQQVREVIPEAVVDPPEGQPLGVDHRLLIAYLIGAVQELSKKVH